MKWLLIPFELHQNICDAQREKLLQLKCFLQREDKFREGNANADHTYQSDERNAGERLNVARTAAKFAGQDHRFAGYQQDGGNLFLDRLERLLRERFQVANVVRTAKPTFAKPAPPGIIEQLRAMDAVVEALAD